MTQNLAKLWLLCHGSRVTPLHELIDVVWRGVVLRGGLEDLLIRLQVLLVGIGALIGLVRLLRLQNVRVLSLWSRLVLALLKHLKHLKLIQVVGGLRGLGWRFSLLR